MQNFLSDIKINNAALLVFANKQDLPNTITLDEITEKLGLQNIKNMNWEVQSFCAKTGEGLCEGFEWLSNAIKKD